jgi:hypothetical protein
VEHRVADGPRFEGAVNLFLNSSRLLQSPRRVHHSRMPRKFTSKASRLANILKRLRCDRMHALLDKNYCLTLLVVYRVYPWTHEGSWDVSWKGETFCQCTIPSGRCKDKSTYYIWKGMKGGYRSVTRLQFPSKDYSNLYGRFVVVKCFLAQSRQYVFHLRWNGVCLRSYHQTSQITQSQPWYNYQFAVNRQPLLIRICFVVCMKW